MTEHRKNKLTLMQASLTYKDARFSGYDCACVIEVIEHIEPLRLPAFERNVFEFAGAGTVILTTPNKEYNVTINLFLKVSYVIPTIALNGQEKISENGRSISASNSAIQLK